MTDTTSLLLTLLILHSILESVLSICWQRLQHKHSTLNLISAAVIHGLVVLAVLSLWQLGWMFALYMALVVTVTRFIITLSLERLHLPLAATIIVRQVLFCIILVAVWLTATGRWAQIPVDATTIASPRHLLIALIYLLVTHPASTVIAALLSRWSATLNHNESLQHAATLIGYLERILIVTFVLLDQWQAIGFLLTAKSILRFNDLKGARHRPLSEYVLLGTLLSFSISIFAGLLASRLLNG